MVCIDDVYYSIGIVTWDYKEKTVAVFIEDDSVRVERSGEGWKGGREDGWR